MKRLIVVAAGTVALMSGVAYADGGCAYGQHLASEQVKSPVIAKVDETETLGLKKRKSIEEQASIDALIKLPVIHN